MAVGAAVGIMLVAARAAGRAGTAGVDEVVEDCDVGAVEGREAVVVVDGVEDGTEDVTPALSQGFGGEGMADGERCPPVGDGAGGPRYGRQQNSGFEGTEPSARVNACFGNTAGQPRGCDDVPNQPPGETRTTFCAHYPDVHLIRRLEKSSILFIVLSFYAIVLCTHVSYLRAKRSGLSGCNIQESRADTWT